MSPHSACHPLADWSAQERAAVVGVITDIDDTLTNPHGLMPQALGALQALRSAGLPVLAVTGRPVGWCLPFLAGHNPWPLSAIVAENGAVALQRDATGNVQRHYRLDDAAERTRQHARLQQVLARVEREIAGACRARDSAGRETDIAIDHSEFHRLPPEAIAQVLALLRGEGLRATVSSIHVNAWIGDHDKWVGAQWALHLLLGQDLARGRGQWVYVGDSANDEVMFQHLPHSVGVANIAACLPQLRHPPRFLCRHERGEGFAELAEALISARATG